MSIHSFYCLALLELTVLVDALLYENPLKRSEIQLLAHLSELYEQLATQQFARAVGAVTKQLADG